MTFYSLSDLIIYCCFQRKLSMGEQELPLKKLATPMPLICNLMAEDEFCFETTLSFDNSNVIPQNVVKWQFFLTV